MSASRNFRVNVNLSNFFNDHRHTVRLFINDNIDTIEDLKRKIGRIFGLEDFYLTCQNEYLPPSEDVRILQKDELLWAMPDKYQQSKVSNSLLDSEPSPKKPCKAKKRSISASEECAEELIRPKKKKKKHSKEKYEKDVSNIKTLLPVLHSHINSYNERNNTFSKTDKETYVDNTKNVCKGNLENYTKKVTLPTVTEEYLKKKKVNIVKIDYVFGNGKTKKNDDECTEKDQVMDTSASNKVLSENDDLQLQKQDSEKIQETVKTSETQNFVPPSRGGKYFFMPPSYTMKDNAPNICKNVLKTDDNNIYSSLTVPKCDTNLDESEGNNHWESFASEVSKDKSSSLVPDFHNLSYRKLKKLKSKELSRIELEKVTTMDMQNGHEEQKFIPSVLKINNVGSKTKKKDELAEKGHEIDISEVMDTNNGLELPKEDLKKYDKQLQEETGTTSEMQNPVPLSRSCGIFFTPPSCTINESHQKRLQSSNYSTLSPILTKSDIHLNDSENDNNWESFSSEASKDKHSFQFSSIDNFSYKKDKKLKSKELSGIGHILEHLRTSDSFVNTTGENPFELVSKRRRHRKRPSKKPITNVDESVIVIEPSPKPMIAKACPSMHLKFVEDDQNDHVVAVDVKKRDENKSHMSDMESPIVDENFEIRDEKIKEYPLMGDLLPKSGDELDC